MDGVGDEARGYSLSVYRCIPLHPLLDVTASPKPLSLAKIVATTIHMNTMARRPVGEEA
jgi:hypothetical protein